MLIEFSVGNFRSFRDVATLSLLTSKLKENDELDNHNIFQEGKWSLLRSAAIFGANASGKSNFIRAFGYMRYLVLESATGLQAGQSTKVTRFALNPTAKEQPAYFQIAFLIDGIQYRYGFELDEQRVHAEWLYRTKQRESRLFVREGQNFDISTTFRKEVRGLEELTRQNALFLSVLAQFNSPTAGSLLSWFRNRVGVISGINDEHYLLYTLARVAEDDIFRQQMAMLLRLADVGIHNVRVESASLSDPAIPEHVRNFFEKIAEIDGEKAEDFLLRQAKMTHPVFQDGKRIDEMEFELEEESAGTQKFFALLGPILDTLEHGKVLVVDELEARLHPLLTRELVRLFNSAKTNPNRAQLIFATHDIDLLGENLLRRDQVWFTEKNRYGETELYSLAEMKERKDASYLKNYLLGRYGAIPYINRFRAFIEQELSDGAEA